MKSFQIATMDKINKVFLVFLMFFSCLVFGQTAKLNTLSNQKFIDSKIVYEDNGEDVFGYFLLYENDRINKDVYQLEYVLLDKNLNKLSSNMFLQSRYRSMFVKLKPCLSLARKKGDLLYISIGDIAIGYGDMSKTFGVYNFRTLNLKDYSMSGVSFVKDYALEKQDSQKLSLFDAMSWQYMKPTKSGYFIADNYKNSLAMSSLSEYIKVKPAKELHFYDSDLNKKWVAKVNEQSSSKFFSEYSYINEYNGDLLFRKIQVNLKLKENEKQERSYETFFEVLDAETGKKKFDFVINDPTVLIDLVTVKNDPEKIVFYATTTALENKNKSYKNKITGYVKIEIDRNTGKELRRDYFKWNVLSEKLAIDGFGEIKEYGFLNFVEIVRIKEKTVIIAEGFKPDENTKILDLFVIELDENLKLSKFFKVEKPTYQTKRHYYWPQEIEENNFSDYQYYQQLSENEYVFIYTTRDNNDTAKEKSGFGVISYVNGEFDFQGIPQKENQGKIHPSKAKKGYILLRTEAEDEKNSELRIEKINF